MATLPDPLLGNAVLATVAYADMFDFPLQRQEIQRDLIGLAAPVARTTNAVETLLYRGQLAPDGAYLTFPGRRGLAQLRQRREARAARLWPVAQRFGRIIARFPFVRLVAVTGSLAAGNPGDQADIDYLIVTAPGRLWSVRAAVVALVRLARRGGVPLCPNYLLSTRALALDHQDLFTAHELLQAVPVAGAVTYRRLVGCNAWAASWLPQRYDHCQESSLLLPAELPQYRWSEDVLSGGLADRVEQWEAQRKQRRLSRGGAGRFTADICEGHFGKSRRHALCDFEQRCRELGIVPPAMAPSEREQREPGALRPVLLPAL